MYEFLGRKDYIGLGFPYSCIACGFSAVSRLMIVPFHSPFGSNDSAFF